MDHKAHLLTIAEGAKIDAATMVALQNSAWGNARDKVKEYMEKGHSEDEIIHFLGKIAAYHKAAYDAYSQELAVRGISLRQAKAQENAAKDKADRIANAQTKKNLGDEGPDTRFTNKSIKTRSRSTERESPTYTKDELKVMKLLMPLCDGNFDAIEEIANAICISRGVKLADLVGKYKMFGAPK